jgi:hypothetical protein
MHEGEIRCAGLRPGDACWDYPCGRNVLLCTRYTDRNVYRHVLVSEVADGNIARASPGLQGNL